MVTIITRHRPLAAAASLALLVICCCSSQIIAPFAEAFSSPSSTSNLFRPPPYITSSSSSSSSIIQPPTNRERILSKFQSIRIATSTHTQRRRLLHSSSEDASSSTTTTTNGSTTTSINGQEDDLTKLKAENRLLQERLKLLQTQNDELLKQQQQQQQMKGETKPTIEQRLILEDFEGWPTDVAMGGDGWNKREKRYDTADESFIGGGGGDDGNTDNDNGGGSNIIGTYNDDTVEDDDELGLVSSGLDEDELCEYDDQSNKWSNGVGECPIEPNITFLDAMKSRAYWLVGLLALQSCSGFILSRNELLLQDHPVIVYFLTMLVGAGGNAGNQASVRVIRGLALGTLNPTTQSQFLSREIRMAFALSAILSIAGFTRAILFQTPFPETMAVTLALSMIVFSSICLGAVLPLVLQKMGVDPAHSSTTIQVIMDILGVVLTVFVSTAVLDSVWGKMLIKMLGNMGL